MKKSHILEYQIDFELFQEIFKAAGHKPDAEFCCRRCGYYLINGWQGQSPLKDVSFWVCKENKRGQIFPCPRKPRLDLIPKWEKLIKLPRLIELLELFYVEVPPEASQTILLNRFLELE